MKTLAFISYAFVTFILTAVNLRADTVTGTVRTVAGVPVAGVTLDFNGGITPINPTTNAFGVFTVTVPAGTYDIGFLPPNTTLAPIQILGVIVAGTANLGTVTLQPGFVLSGTVLTSAAAPVATADINVYDAATGVKLFTPSDNTNASGIFSVVVPAGTFHVRAAPPTGLILVAQQIYNVAVPATTNAGIITLPPGVVVTGSVLNSQTQAPLANVDIDVDDAVTGQRIITPNDNTNSSGLFSVIIPTGTFNFGFSPPPGMLIVAAQAFNIVIAGTTNVGNIVLDPGSSLSGTVLGPGGVPVSGVDIDVDRFLGNVRIYTPGDTTSAQGTFTVVVPNGSYSVTVEPPQNLLLVGASVTPVIVSGPTSIGTVTLQGGVILTGTLIGWNGLPEAGADIDVLNPQTLAEVVTPNDGTDVNGHWSVVVPTGTWSVRFQTKKASLSRDATVPAVAVTGPSTTLNFSLALLPLAIYLDRAGPGVPIVSGAPVVIDAVLYNPTPSLAQADLRLLLVDPLGVESLLFPPLPVIWPGFFFFWWQALPVPLPPVTNPVFHGQPFKLRVRLTEIGTGAEIDRDEFSFTIL